MLSPCVSSITPESIWVEAFNDAVSDSFAVLRKRPELGGDRQIRRSRLNLA